jgi:hypothetical protein
VKTVRIVHPNAGEANVPASSVPHWKASGWSLADEAPKAEQADQDHPADSAPDHTASPARRRAPKESE